MPFPKATFVLPEEKNIVATLLQHLCTPRIKVLVLQPHKIPNANMAP